MLFSFIVLSVFSSYFVHNVVIFTEVPGTGYQNSGMYLSVCTAFTLSNSRELHTFLPAGHLQEVEGTDPENRRREKEITHTVSV